MRILVENKPINLKSALIYFFSFSLLIAILAPSIIRFLELGEGEQIVMDFNEEDESNEENTFEFAEKHFLTKNLQGDLAFLGIKKSLSSDKKDIDLIASNSIEVFLPPPKV